MTLGPPQAARRRSQTSVQRPGWPVSHRQSELTTPDVRRKLFVSPIFVRSALRSSRRRLAVVVVLLGLAGSVAVHHGMPMDMHAMSGQSICLALLAGAVLLVAGVVLARARRPRPRAPKLSTPVTPSGSWCRSVPARAGPLYLRLAVLRL